ncbi:MAG: thiamine pyrophosphate-binding protein [Thermomicrobia bacterium]|nr:thiamine pyrophosphate-binding protein [Thermomicrobia bacterium]
MSTDMERSDAVIAGLAAIKPAVVPMMPSSTLKQILNWVMAQPNIRSFPVTREEEAIGIMGGLALTGTPAVLIMQDNGVGNFLTALTTFPQAYHLPCFMLIARRGGLGEYNSMIHLISERVPAILDAANIRTFLLDAMTPLDHWTRTVVKGYEFAQITHRPVAVLVNLMGG